MRQFKALIRPKRRNKSPKGFDLLRERANLWTFSRPTVNSRVERELAGNFWLRSKLIERSKRLGDD